MDATMMERVGDRYEKMEGSCSTGQSPPWAVVPVEEEGEECRYTLCKDDWDPNNVRRILTTIQKEGVMMTLKGSKHVANLHNKLMCLTYFV
jgi:hypothetical protein